MLEWPLSGDAISARGDETLGGLTKPGETARVSGGTCMVQPRDARKIPLTPRGSSVRVPEKKKKENVTTFDGSRATPTTTDFDKPQDARPEGATVRDQRAWRQGHPGNPKGHCRKADHTRKRTP